MLLCRPCSLGRSRSTLQLDLDAVKRLITDVLDRVPLRGPVNGVSRLGFAFPGLCESVCCFPVEKDRLDTVLVRTHGLTPSLQLGVLRLGLLEDGDVGIGVSWRAGSAGATSALAA